MALKRAMALLVIALLIPGCGTFTSIDGEARVYGGVRLDASTMVAKETSGITRTVSIVDIPFSLVMDTLFLPYTIGIALGRSLKTGTKRPGSGHGHPH